MQVCESLWVPVPSNTMALLKGRCSWVTAAWGMQLQSCWGVSAWHRHPTSAGSYVLEYSMTGDSDTGLPSRWCEIVALHHLCGPASDANHVQTDKVVYMFCAWPDTLKDTHFSSQRWAHAFDSFQECLWLKHTDSLALQKCWCSGTALVMVTQVLDKHSKRGKGNTSVRARKGLQKPFHFADNLLSFQSFLIHPFLCHLSPYLYFSFSCPSFSCIDTLWKQCCNAPWFKITVYFTRYDLIRGLIMFSAA